MRFRYSWTFCKFQVAMGAKNNQRVKDTDTHYGLAKESTWANSILLLSVPSICPSL